MEQETQTPHKRRGRYKGKYPKKFEEKYKELQPEKYQDTNISGRLMWTRRSPPRRKSVWRIWDSGRIF